MSEWRFGSWLSGLGVVDALAANIENAMPKRATASTPANANGGRNSGGDGDGDGTELFSSSPAFNRRFGKSSPSKSSSKHSFSKHSFSRHSKNAVGSERSSERDEGKDEGHLSSSEQLEYVRALAAKSGKERRKEVMRLLKQGK
eukprot:5705158-Pleurochrysis_carterae.AAC.1